MKHTTEIRVTKSNGLGKSKWQVDSYLRQVLVDGVFVGYCTPAKGTLNIAVDAPQEIIDAATEAVGEYWGVSVEQVSTLSPIEPEEEDEDELDD